MLSTHRRTPYTSNAPHLRPPIGAAGGFGAALIPPPPLALPRHRRRRCSQWLWYVMLPKIGHSSSTSFPTVDRLLVVPCLPLLLRGAVVNRAK